MSKAKLNGLLHVVAQLLAQGAIVALIPIAYKPIFSAITATLGVILAYLDTTWSSQ